VVATHNRLSIAGAMLLQSESERCNNCNAIRFRRIQASPVVTLSKAGLLQCQKGVEMKRKGFGNRKRWGGKRWISDEMKIMGKERRD